MIRRGFTLLELLVVCLILGILATVVVVNFTGTNYRDDVRREANQLLLLIELSRRETLARNETWGLFIENADYYFGQLNPIDASWLAVDIPPYRDATLPEEVQVRSVELVGSQPSKRSEETPVLIIYPNGEITPVQLELMSIDGRFVETLASDGIQRMRFVDPS